jgi:hypothetical protein
VSLDSKSRCELLNNVTVRAAQEYAEFVRIGGVIEDKAQKTTVAAGAFLAAGLGLLTSESTRNILINKIGRPELVLLFLVIALLLLTSAAALPVAWASSSSVPAVDALFKSTNDVLSAARTEAESNGLLEAFYAYQATTWIQALGQLRVRVKLKSRWLRAVQVTFAVAIYCIGLFLLLTLKNL